MIYAFNSGRRISCSLFFRTFGMFSTLIQQILVQLREALNARTENYYQTFALDTGDAVNVNDGTVSAQ